TIQTDITAIRSRTTWRRRFRRTRAPLSLSAILPARSRSPGRRCTSMAGCISGRDWRDIEPHADPLQLRRRGGIEAHDQGIVAGNDMRGAVGQVADAAPALDHLADMEDDREGPRLLVIGVKMRGVGGEDDPAAPGPDADDLKPHRVAADVMDCDAGRKLGRAVMEGDAPLMDPADQPDHILDGV